MVLAQRLKKLLTPAVEAVGFELWGLEMLSQGPKKTLRVYIDGPSGVQVDDCALVSHQISGVLDVEDPIPGEYYLEVSSPGLDRPLFTIEHFQRYLGSKVSVLLNLPVNGRRRLSGLIESVDDKKIVMDVDGEYYEFALSGVKKANLHPDDKLPKKK